MAFLGKIFWKLSCETSEQMLLQIFAHWPVTITSISDCGERDNYKNDGISRPRVMNIWLFFPSICFNRKNRNHEVKDKYFPRRTHKGKSLSLKFSYFLGKHFSKTTLFLFFFFAFTLTLQSSDFLTMSPCRFVADIYNCTTLFGLNLA